MVIQSIARAGGFIVPSSPAGTGELGMALLDRAVFCVGNGGRTVYSGVVYVFSVMAIWAKTGATR